MRFRGWDHRSRLAWLVAVRGAAACAGLLGVLVGSVANAGQSFDPTLADMGASHYAQHCSACHGSFGRGDGPVAPALNTVPADLTRIAARRDGVFPASEIARFIDGRFEISAHGSREMPVWGERLSANIPEPGLGDELARGVIATLVEYLKSIQRDE